MRTRNNYDSDNGITYYVHSFKEVFEELPEWFYIENSKNRKNKSCYMKEEAYDKNHGCPSGHKSKFDR